jgi:excinuclease ABC subunit A
MRPISIICARTHNLKNISVDIPRNKLTVITGVSGSGKSSLAFDTLYAEGQRRYVESLSAYARQFLERMDRPDVDEIRGIAPAVAIEQKNPTKSSRSTVGTATEVEDYLRLLFARIGTTVCPQCGDKVEKHQVQDVVQQMERLPHGTPIAITFPRKIRPEALGESISILKSNGFHRIYDNGKVTKLSDLNREITDLDVLVDRLMIDENSTTRLADSISLAFSMGNGKVAIFTTDRAYRFSEAFECARCNMSFVEPQPRLFSFNNPFGACPACKGFGDIIHIDENLVIPDKSKSIFAGCISPFNTSTHRDIFDALLIECHRNGIDIHKPYSQLNDESKKLIWQGAGQYPGLDRFFQWLESKKYKIGVRVMLSRYRGYVRCGECHGTRLRKEALNVFINGKNIGNINKMAITEAHKFFGALELTPYQQHVAGQILKELRNRLLYLNDIGLGYLTLDRRTATISGGEFQRINLATALGSHLVGSLYILDEPTIGLHPRDTESLIKILKSLRDIGNSVVIVEHDRELIRNADYLIDLGPGAGEQGGQVIFQGDYDGILSDGFSLTGAYLRGNKMIPLPDRRRESNGQYLEVIGAAEHNLKSIDVKIPLGLFVVVTGVSGSGKSSLVHDVIYTGLLREKKKWKKRVGRCEAIKGTVYIDDVVMVDQSPIGKTPRSNPVTYIKAFEPVRRVFAGLRRARLYGYGPGHFSFNVPGGRCETCQGAGVVKVEMQFLADLFLECETCGGKRYKKEILDIRYKGKSIYDVLEMTVAEALLFFSEHHHVVSKLSLLRQVGLGYIKLGQPATTLSGGEAQRVKLAAHLGDKTEQHTLYIFDEPTTGLHFDDVATLLECFNALLKANNSLLVIEHNIDIIKCADYIIDLGPEGGQNGGQIVAVGTPEKLATLENSFTGQYLRQHIVK